MLKSVEILEVAMNNIDVGKLIITSEHLCAFEYNTGYLSSGISVSPFYLPLKPGVFIAKRDPFNGLFGVFNDSLPDGWGMLLTDRFLMKNKINPAKLTLLDRLCLVGNAGMGALTYKPDHAPEGDNDYKDLNQLSSEVQRILNNDFTGSLEELYQKGGSSGGARPKVLVSINNEYWIIKFRASADPENIGEIEYQYSQVAGKCGLEMPETSLFEDRFFGVKRFDRYNNFRYHVHSAGGLLYASHRFPSLDYADLLKACMALTLDIEQSYSLFRLMVFNILTHNRDDHVKNFSFILIDRNWKLSPAYDLVLSNGFNGQHTTTVAGNGEPKRKDIFEVAKAGGLDEKKAHMIFDEVYEASKEIRHYIP
jgi:serine/threonine-protein kinase HipA